MNDDNKWWREIVAKRNADEAESLLPEIESRLQSLEPLAVQIGFHESGVHWKFAYDAILLAYGNIAKIRRGEKHGCPLSCIGTAKYELDLLERLASFSIKKEVAA